MITGFLNSQMASTPKLDSLKQQLNSSRFSLNVAKYEADSHYDAMAMDIDIRAETLINLIHDKRAQLLKNVDALRLQTDNDFIELTDLHARQYSRLKENYATIAKKLEVSSSLIEKDLDELMRSFNKIQQSIDSVKSGIFQFVANPEECDSGLLGRFLKRENVMYSKIQNLAKSSSIQVQFQSDLTAKIHRNYLIPLCQEKTVGINFMSDRSIELELFDHTGSVLRSLTLANEASYYPIFSSSSEHLVISYQGGRSETNVALFNSSLDLIKAIKLSYLLESVFVNSEGVVCTYAHKKAEICQIYDLQLNIVGSFGQKLQETEPFLMRMNKETSETLAKKNPTVFGLTKERLYFCTDTEVVVQCRQSGRVLASCEKKEASQFLVANSGELIEVDLIVKEVSLLKEDLQATSVSSRYTFSASSVFLVDGQLLALVNAKDRKITYI